MKIAIVNHWPHNCIGGIETYSRMLIDIFKTNGFDVEEFSVWPNGVKISKPINGVKQHDISSGKVFNYKAHRIIKELLKTDEYDLVINNSLDLKESFSKNSKVINVQHWDWKAYSFFSSHTWFRVFASLLGMGYFKNPVKATNTVFYISENEKWGSKNPLYQPLPLQKDYVFVNRKTPGKNIFWMARLHYKQKGLKHLNKFYWVSKHKEKIVIAGDGPDKDKLKVDNNNLIGKLDAKGIAKNFIHSKVFIMTSNTEGFAFTLVEALAHGTPIVMFDSFTSASFYKDCPAVKLIKHKDIKAFDQAVNEIMEMPDKEWLKLSKEATSFAKKHFSQEVFKKNWTKYIKDIKKNYSK